MREVYILATEQADPVPLETLRANFEAEEVEFTPGEDGRGFALKTDTSRVHVHFEPIASPLKLDPELLSGNDEAIELLNRARGAYRISFEGGDQPSLAVFEALWCARNILEQVDGVVLDVTASKVHDADDITEITELDFDIRDHVNLHAVEIIEGETPLWVHSHGMEKFGTRDVEVFHLSEKDLQAAESFIHELCTDLAFGHGPAPRALVATSEGDGFMVQPSEEARVSLLGVALESFEGHEAHYLTAVSAQGRHTLSELLKPYHERFEQEPEERTRELRQKSQAMLPMFKARFDRKGLMEPMTFLVRAPFEVHPEGDPVIEQLWLEVVGWDDGKLVGKLVDGATHTTEWRKGAHVEIDQEQVNAIALGREGRTLDPDEMMLLLNAERPM